MILVVEDDSSLREAICVNLEAEGFATVGVADGLAARAFLEDAKQPELLVCSHDVLIHGGGEPLTWLRKQPDPLGSTPVVIVSDDEPAKHPKTVETWRAQGCLAKPFDLDQLLDLVGRYT